MSDQAEGARATVALVSEQVRATNLLVEKGFADVQRQLDNQSRILEGLPERTARLEERADDHDRRIGALEDRDTRDSEFFRGGLPTVLITGVTLLVAVITAVLLIATHLVH